MREGCGRAKGPAGDGKPPRRSFLAQLGTDCSAAQFRQRWFYTCETRWIGTSEILCIEVGTLFLDAFDPQVHR